jgi:nucleoside-diphosphate-sugar epimerase
MRILLLGGSGLLSGAARRAFARAGHDVSVFARGERPLAPASGVTLLRGDRGDPASLRAVFTRERFDFTVDFLAYGAADVDRLLAVPGFEPGRLVMISSGQVYLVTAAPRPPFRESDADAPLMREPTRGSRDHGEWAYGMGKRAAEAALARASADAGALTLALRLPVVQGEEDRAGSRRLWGWLERLLDGGPLLLPEDGQQRVRFVHADDVATTLLALATAREWPNGPALNLAQPDECTLRELVERVAALAGTVPRFVSADRGTLERAGLADTCAPYWGRWCSRPDPARAIAELGVRPRALTEYLPGVVRAHLEAPRPASHPGYARRAEELALARTLAGS